MAISAVHYALLKEHAPLFARGGSLLEIGEANWYGDMDPRDIAPDAADLFAIAKVVYRSLFAPTIVEAVDINGTPNAMRQNLNAPLELPRQYDVVINHGTAEHVFNIAQVFASMHDACKVGGYMVHESPFTGWRDHGFYTLQPTLFYDVAGANGYELASLSIAHIESRQIIRVASREHCHSLVRKAPKDSILFVVMRKSGPEPFRVPMQGYYDGRLSEEGRKAWYER